MPHSTRRLPRTFTVGLAGIAALIVANLSGAPVVVQVGQSRLAFDVVSIKAGPRPTPELVRSGYQVAFDIDPAHVRISGFTPLALLARAFRVEMPQVDAPDFARSEYF